MAAPVDRRLLRESRVARSHVALAGALGVASAILIVAQAALLAHVIAACAMHGATLAQLRGSLVALAIVLCARALVGGAFELSGRWGAVRVMSALRERLARRVLLDGPEARPAAGRTGELAGVAVQGVDALEAYFAGYLPQLVLASAVPLAVIAWVAVQDPVTAGILALTVPLLVWFMVLVGRGARAQADSRWRALSLLGAHFLDVVQGLATLRAYGRERAQERTLADVGERYRAQTMATLRSAFMSALVLELCAMIGTALVAATIGVQLVAGALTLQAGLTVLLLAPELYSPLRLVGQQFHASADAAGASARLFAALDSPLQVARAERPLPAPDPALAPLRFERVGYRYPGRPEDALHDVSFELAPGRVLALTGASGAGKSTVAALAMRLADPSEGSVTCGGVDLRRVAAEDWRARVAWVPQRPTIFSGTLGENVALYAPDAGREAILAAARAAGLGPLVDELPRGLDTPLGEGARRLSAGQTQRVGLARAFLADRPLLVADEPTAHLDPATARALVATIAQLVRGRTTLLISHDPLLSELADEVRRLADGRLLGAGQALEVAA